MSILQTLATEVLGGLSKKKTGRRSKSSGTGNGSELAQAVIQIVLSVGIPKLIEMFEKAGLGKQIMSWIEPGKNMPITGAQIQKALGSPILSKLTKQTGLDKAAVTSALAKSLPTIIDALTPDGDTAASSVKKASGGIDLGEIGGLLSSLLS